MFAEGTRAMGATRASSWSGGVACVECVRLVRFHHHAVGYEGHTLGGVAPCLKTTTCLESSSPTERCSNPSICATM